MRISVWPTIETRGELEGAEAEWLHTNGAGAYSMSTVALMHTRRFHGMLVAALDPPLERHVVVSHAETCVEVGRRIYNLSTHQFPDVAPTPGFRLLETFSQDPLPRWVYRLGKHRLERKLCLVRGRNVLISCYTWFGRSNAKLTIKPLLSMRPIHGLRKEHGGIAQKVMLRPNQVSVKPEKHLPMVVFGHTGIFLGSPDWWRSFEYPEDMRRHVQYQEDLWTPGVLELILEPGQPTYVSVGVDALPDVEPAVSMDRVKYELLALDPGPDRHMAVRALSIAAEQFRVPLSARPSLLAGYPWLGVSTRDALVSLVGCYLVPRLFEEAKDVLRGVAARRLDDLLVSHWAEASNPVLHPTVDGSLWLFEGVRLLLEACPSALEFAIQEMYPVLTAIYRRVLRTPGETVWLTADGLLSVGGETEPLTWMDSRAGGEAVTPRRGLAVELQALWSRACETLGTLARHVGDEALASQLTQARERTRIAFQRRFWCAAVGYAYDCVDDASGAGDPGVRPNAVLALAIDPWLFESWQAAAIVYAARERLLTPRGLRTLDSTDLAYIGYYEGGMEVRRAAYHQGVVWGYLIGALSRAALAAFPNDFELQMDVRDWVLRSIENGPVLNQVAQVAAGDRPHQAGGCPAQAWSVAEALRTLVQDLGL